MLSSLGNIVQSTIKHVCDTLGNPTEFEPESASSLPQSLPSKSPCQSEQSVVAHAKSNPRTYARASMTNSSQFKRSIVDKLVEGTFDSGVEILDDDEDDEIQEIPPPTTKSRITVDVSKSNKPPREIRTGAGRQISHSERERELPGTTSNHFQDPHFSNNPVRRTTRTMPYGGTKQTFARLGPIDTLGSTKAQVSSKKEHYLGKTHQPTPGLSSSRLTQPRPRAKIAPQSDWDDGPPAKRPRIESPETTGIHHSRGVETSHRRGENVSPVNSAVSKPSLASAYGVEDFETYGTRPNGVRDTPLRKINMEHSVPKGSRRAIRKNSPVAIRSTTNGDHHEENFMRSARRERESRANDSDEEVSYQGEPTSSKPTRTLSSSTIVQDPAQAPKSTRSVSQKITPRIAKMSSRLQESPDVLQTSAQTTVKLLKFASPSRSPPSSRTGKRFPLKRFICAALPVAEAKAYDLEVDEKGGTFSIHYQDPEITEDVIAGPIRVSKIFKMTLPSDDDTNIVVISFSDGVLLGRQCSLDFGDSRKTLTEFYSKILGIDPTIKQLHRASEWIAKNTTNLKELKPVQDTQYEGRREPAKQTTVALHARKKSADSESAFRGRKIDRLDAGPVGQVFRETENEHISNKSSSLGHQHDSDKTRSIATPPVEKVRETRSNATKRSLEHTETQPISIDVEPRHKGTPWKKPLIYPQNGKSRANVTWDDLERLNDDEFLNDNLVALFMRYLQEHMDQEHAKTMHFFSTFFYNALTRPAEKSKSRQINYPAVANWTKTVNLFKRDYVIVPVNEAAHWYLMIICNLRSLQEPDNKDEDVVEITDSVEDDDPVEDPSKVIVESDIVADKEVLEGSGYTEGSKNPAPTSAKKRPGRPKLQPRHRKYAVNQPIIITLDSLDQPRSITASALKSYLVEEAKDKYSLTIDKNDIKGMTAKNILLQDNFSDCGLYLCLYLEQFVRDPAMFVRSILQRDEKSFAWPRALQNGVLRDRLYGMIRQLYDTRNKDDAKLPPIGRLLLKDEDYHEDQLTKRKTTQSEIYEPAHVKAGIDFYEGRRNKDKEQSSADRMLLEEAFPPAAEMRIHNPRLQATELTGTHGSTSQPIVVEDSQDNQKQDDTSSRYFQPRKDENSNSKAARRSDTPQELAERMRKERSPGKAMVDAHTISSTPIDLTTPVPARQVPTNDTSPTEEADNRNTRGVSCSTDYLTGNSRYEDRNGHEPHQRSDGSTTYLYVPDHQMQGTEEEFTGFGDDAVHSRDTSMVPESVHGSQPDRMLLDHRE